jgi:hypothetical protein
VKFLANGQICSALLFSRVARCPFRGRHDLRLVVGRRGDLILASMC